MAVNRAPKILDGCCRAVTATAALAVRREAGEVAVSGVGRLVHSARRGRIHRAGPRA